jgi:hypothetical protein
MSIEIINNMLKTGDSNKESFGVIVSETESGYIVRLNKGLNVRVNSEHIYKIRSHVSVISTRIVGKIGSRPPNKVYTV